MIEIIWKIIVKHDMIKEEEIVKKGIKVKVQFLSYE